MYRTPTILIIAVIILSGFAKNKSESYIDKYKDLAISEMHRTGIPASIKLAQGLLESGAGTSELSINANNHFGIKCGGSWTGETYKIEDDEFRNGKKIKSCFRVFNSAHGSYIAHSQFLLDNRRYAFLFSYSNTDYYCWAKGLRKAGYATDKKYPKKLIDIINKYQLYLFDDVKEGQLAHNKRSSKNENTPSTTSVENASTKASKNKYKQAIANSRAKNEKSSKYKTKTTKLDKEASFHIVTQGQSIRENFLDKTSRLSKLTQMNIYSKLKKLYPYLESVHVC